MKALKNFLKTFHFVSIVIFIVPALLFFSGIFNFNETETIGKAVASISDYYPPVVFHVRDHEPDYFTDFIDENVREIRGTIRAGDNLGKSMDRNHVPEEVRRQVIACLDGVVDFGALKVGDTYSLIIRNGNTLEKGYYESGPFNVYSITNEGGECRVEKKEVLLERHTVRISGTVRTSLYDAFPKDIKDPRLIYAFADIFASKIDFNTETRAGDRFELIVDEYYRYYDFVGYGKIRYARYEQADGGVFEAFLFDTGKEKAYFNDQGHELGAFFLRSPVPMGRVTSRFTYHRMHPILGVVRKHLGVDLAAPRGTPVMAAADGKVFRMGYNGGFGNQIVLSHGSGYKTYYGHLSRFRKGLKVGMRVRKKEIIGYVGATGMATGPHLDYRISENGIFKNPFSLKFKPRSTLKGEKLARLREKAGRLRRLAARLARGKTMLVKSVTATPRTVDFL
jgi:murein DD-endopeptidase MepM/ murein hydrolase activator NlpD